MSATGGLAATPRQRGHKKRSRELIEAVGGFDVAALHCRIGKSQLQECCSEHKAAFLPQDVIADLEEVAGAPIVTRHLACLASNVMIPMPRADEDGQGLLRSTMTLTSELGDVAREIDAALRDDDCASHEAEAVLVQLDELDRASATLRLQLKAIADGAR